MEPYEELPPVPSTEDDVYLRLLSRPDWVEPVVLALKDRARQAGIDDEARLCRLTIALSEAITNAIVHGNYGLDSNQKTDAIDNPFAEAVEKRKTDPAFLAKLVQVRMSQESDQLIWHIEDQGQGFNFESLLRALDESDHSGLQEEDSKLSGRGVAIIRAFVDEVSWEKDGRCIRLAVHVKRDENKRDFPRHEYTQTVQVYRVLGRAILAQARNLSRSGLAFVTNEPIKQDERVEIEMTLPSGMTCRTLGTIVRCRSIAAPYFDIAVRFTQPLAEEWVEPAQQAA